MVYPFVCTPLFACKLISAQPRGACKNEASIYICISEEWNASENVTPVCKSAVFLLSNVATAFLVQECIPVGCVPPACWPYPSMHCGGGVPAWGCTYLGGVPAQVVPSQGGVPARGYTYLGVVPAQGGYLPGGLCVPARGSTCPGTPPPPWTDIHV